MSTPDLTIRAIPKAVWMRSLATAQKYSSAPADGARKAPVLEYERIGVVNLFLLCEPLRGRRWVDVDRAAHQDGLRQTDQGVGGHKLPTAA